MLKEAYILESWNVNKMRTQKLVAVINDKKKAGVITQQKDLGKSMGGM